MDFVFKGILALFWLIVIPTCCGALFFKKTEAFSPAKSFLFGYLFLFSSAELFILIFMYLRRPLHELVLCYGIIAVLGAAGGIFLFRQRKTKLVFSFSAVRNTSLYLWAAVALITFQVVIAVLLAHHDADDALYVAAATTAVDTDSIFRVNAYTGLPYVRLPRRYILSPFPIFLAITSQLCGGLHPAIMAHTVFPAVFIPAAYLVQDQIGKNWFSDNKTGRGVYLFTAAVLIWFSAYSAYNAGNFQMVRIWQGKAILASVLLPFLFYLSWTIVMKKQAEHSWLLYAMANLSACLLSSMGIILAPLMMGIFIFMGIFTVRSVKNTLLGLLCCLPSILLGASYIFILLGRKWGIL